MAVLLITEKLLAGVGNSLELPAALIATTTNFPNALALVVKLIVAEFPVGSIETDPTAIADGTNAGMKENVEAVRLAPVTVTVAALFAKAPFGVTDVMIGPEVTTKLVLEVAVAPATVTEIGPVVASLGTLTTSAVPLAEKTVAGAPLKRTVFADGAALKPCPRMVTAVNGPPWPGEKSKIANAPGAIPLRLTSRIFPTGS